MPSDLWRQQAEEQARIRAARRRAGLAAALKPKPKPVRIGDSARDKSRVAPVQRVREAVDRLNRGGKPEHALRAFKAAGLTESEERDVESYSGVKSRQTQKKLFSDLKSDTASFVDKAVGYGVGVRPSTAFDALRHPVRRINEAGKRPPPRAEETAMFAMGGSLLPGMRRRGRQADEVAEVAAPKPGADILEAMPAARRLRNEQERLRKAERAERAAKMKAASERAGGGEAGALAARAEMKGEYTTLPFAKLAKVYGDAGSDLRARLQPDVDDLHNIIAAHPSMEGLAFRTQNTQAALRKVLGGGLPTKSEERLLTDVFGAEVPQHFKHRRATDQLVKVLNVPRAAKATADLSFPFRQALVSGTSHPRLWARSWKPMLKAAKSEKGYQALKESIRTHPKYEEAKELGLAVTDLEGNIKTTEEALIGADLIERTPFGLGKIARGSNRAYDAFGSKFRIDLYDYLTEGPALTTAEKRDLTSIINAGTGRGNMGSATLEKAAPFLTLGFFSPRLIASRISFLNPVYYAKLSKPARKEMRRSVLSLVGTGSAVLFLAEQMGADVVKDPRNADFGKIRLGDTRIDIWGGFGQYVVNGYRIIKGESVSSTTGELKKLEGGFAKKSRYDILREFGEGKAAPVPAFLIGSGKGKKGDGTEFNEAKEAGKLFAPLGWQSATETYLDAGAAPAAATLGLGGVGIGVQTYGTDPIKVEEAKKRMALAKRGPVHVRDHEDRMTTLTAAAKAAGLPTSDLDVQIAVASSRRIRNLDMQLRQAEKKKGNALTYEERAKIVGRMALRVFPEYRSEIQAELASKEWKRVYQMLRHEIRAPYENAVG